MQKRDASAMPLPCFVRELVGGEGGLHQRGQARACGDRAKVSCVSKVLCKTIGLNYIEKICSISILRVPYNQNSLSRQQKTIYRS